MALGFYQCLANTAARLIDEKGKEVTLRKPEGGEFDPATGKYVVEGEEGTPTVLYLNDAQRNTTTLTLEKGFHTPGPADGDLSEFDIGDKVKVTNPVYFDEPIFGTVANVTTTVLTVTLEEPYWPIDLVYWSNFVSGLDDWYSTTNLILSTVDDIGPVYDKRDNCLSVAWPDSTGFFIAYHDQALSPDNSNVFAYSFEILIPSTNVTVVAARLSNVSSGESAGLPGYYGWENIIEADKWYTIGFTDVNPVPSTNNLNLIFYDADGAVSYDANPNDRVYFRNMRVVDTEIEEPYPPSIARVNLPLPEAVTDSIPFNAVDPDTTVSVVALPLTKLDDEKYRDQLVKGKLSKFLMAGKDNPVPSVEDQIIDGSDTYKIFGVTPLKPTNTPVIYKLKARLL